MSLKESIEKLERLNYDEEQLFLSGAIEENKQINIERYNLSRIVLKKLFQEIPTLDKFSLRYVGASRVIDKINDVALGHILTAEDICAFVVEVEIRVSELDFIVKTFSAIRECINCKQMIFTREEYE